MTKSKIPESSQVSRRRFVSFAALAGGAVVAPHGYSWSSRAKVYPPELHETIIIGSGFGAAITAYRLTEAAQPVLMLEQGRRWDQALAAGQSRFSKNLYPDGRSTWLSNKTVIPLGPPLPIPKTTGVLQGRQLAGKTVLNGAAFGGGSIVYGGILAKPEKHIFEQVFPPSIRFEELEPHYASIGQRLKRSTLPSDVEQSDYYRHVRVMKEQCERADIEWEDIPTATRWDVVRDEIEGKVAPSVIHGEAVYGVNSGAKVGLDTTYLRDAEATGLLDVRTLHQVQSISQNADGLYELTVHELNVDGDIVGLRTFLSRRLFLAAGTVGSNSLLVKAKAKGELPRLNDQVGQGWGNNGNVYALRLAVGAATGRWQGGPPSVGIKDLDNPLGPLFIEHPQLPLGADIFGLMYFGIGINETRGSFRYVPEKDEVVLDYPKDDAGQKRINKALLNTLDKLNRANGGITTSLLTYLKDKVKDDICYHPLGGLELGKACDLYGRVAGYEGLYVNDGSLMPGSSGCVNPSFTIAALAERNVQEILTSDYGV